MTSTSPLTPPTPAPGPNAGAANDTVPTPAGVRKGVVIQLRKIPLLSGLSDEEMNKVKGELRLRQYAKREVVLHKGGVGDALLFLLIGQLQVIDVTEDGRAIGLRMLMPGDFFGEIALINQSTRSASVVAMTEVLVGFLPAPTALHLFSHAPSVAQQVLQYLARKIQRDSEFRALLSINNTAKRIFAYLSLMAQPGSQPGQLVIDNLPTHQDIANMINTSRETVTRALLTLVQLQVIQKDGHRLIVLDPDKLRDLIRAG